MKEVNKNREEALCKVNKDVGGKIIALIASVAEREEQLKIVLHRIYNQVDEIHLVLNWYEKIPIWLEGATKIIVHPNPENKNAHDSVWNYVTEQAYYLILDDDLYYPEDYTNKMIKAIERHKRRAVITAHGSYFSRPVTDYFHCRTTYGFSDYLERDIFVDLAGCGAVAFHSSTIQPTLQHFPIPFCRDLWFSILCAKKKVKIVNLKRIKGWILPLKTPGDTIYDLSRKDKRLKQIKGRILKEQFLPLLYCNQEINKYCLITDYDFDKLLLDKTLETLSKVSDCNTLVFSNRAKRYGENILTQHVIPEELAMGAMGSKVLIHYRFISGLPNDSEVISADADLYYLKDPFFAFKMHKDFDIAVTTRPYKYHYPINGGVVMFRVNNRVRGFLNFLASQIFKRTWPELIFYQKQFNHTGNHWYIDQDMICVAWLFKEDMQKRFGVKIVDVGPYFNYCPHADGASTEDGKRKLMEAYENKSAAVLHLKSRLKELLFSGDLK